MCLRSGRWQSSVRLRSRASSFEPAFAPAVKIILDRLCYLIGPLPSKRR